MYALSSSLHEPLSNGAPALNVHSFEGHVSSVPSNADVQIGEPSHVGGVV